MNIESLLICSCLNFTILLIWYHSTAILEYGRLFGLKKLLKDEQFQSARKESNFKLNYPNFLLSTYPNFFTKLIQCPICFNIWLGMLGGIFTKVQYMPIIFTLSILLYFTFVFLANGGNKAGLSISKA